MNDTPIFTAVRKIVRRHSKNQLEGLTQIDVDELNEALKIARGAHHEPVGQAGAGIGVSAPTTQPSPPERQIRALTDPPKFFEIVRNRFGRLSQPQVEGITFLLGKMGKAGWPIAWVAYGLATAWHETAQRMQPVREGLDVSDAWRKRNLRYYPHYGRGYPQTTWPENYAKADEKLGLSGTLVANPDRMLEPDIAADTMIRGMEEGWFAGDGPGGRNRHTLQRHLPSHNRSTPEQRREARRIINGTDKAVKIADEAGGWEAAVIAGGWS
jgi:putative chitinase